MAATAINQLKQYFETGDTPTQEQFEAVLDSFRHLGKAITIDDLDADLKASIQNAAGDSNDFKISFYNAVIDLPANGSNKVLYVVLSTSTLYVWNVNAYQQVGGGDAKMKESFTTNVNYPGLPSGTQINTNDDMSGIIKRLLLTVLYPNIINLSVGLTNTANIGSLYVIGPLTQVQLAMNFNRGVIDYASASINRPNEPLAGVATVYTFIQGNDNPFPSMPQAGSTYTISNFAPALGLNRFKGKVAYASGPQPLDSNGNNYGNPLPAGESDVAEYSFEGVLPLYVKTNDPMTYSQQELISFLYNNVPIYSLVAESGGNKQGFQLPVALLNSRPLIAINYFNTVSNQWDTTNKLQDFAVTDVTKQVALVNRPYKQYLNLTSDRGAVRIRLIFQ